ncbi:transposase [Trichonephila clavipes]|nr:transposase [Trichonephila clavipes]
MIITGFSNNGKLEIRRVSCKAKINLLYYQQNILEPFFAEEIPTLYLEDIDKFELRMDKASSHMSNSTAAYLAKKESETRIMCIPFDKMRVKSPYAFKMDFFAFGLLKRVLGI